MTKKKCPIPFLQPGDTVGIVAPGRKVAHADIRMGITTLEEWGLKVVLAPNLFKEGHSYLSGTDAQRLKDLQGMLDNPRLKGIICARGGYGTTRILDALDFKKFLAHPKWVVGFSDITALLLHLHTLKMPAVHGTMPLLFDSPAAHESVASLRKALFGGPEAIPAPAHPSNRSGTGKGTLIGGNLSLVVDSLGTRSEPDTRGKILFLEEIDEYTYKIDRMMVHLKRAGKLEYLAGLVVGHLTNIKDTDKSFSPTAEPVIAHHVKAYRYPVAFGFPIGHENPNLAFVHGGPATLTVSRKGAVLIPGKY